MKTITPTLIQLEQELTRENLHELNQINPDKGSIAFDLSNTRTVDTHGLATLLRIKKQLSKHGFDVVLINPKPSIRTLLYATKLNTVLHSFTNLSSANLYFLRHYSDNTSGA
ncbi:MAG: STAS domain-containing protein [Arenicella sp.]